MRTPFRSSPLIAKMAAGTLLTAAALTATTASAIEFGTASVLSAKGQRLKVMVPFEATPGELISVTQFQVVSSESSPGTTPPDPGKFTLSMPMNSNMLMLQSAEHIQADSVHIVLGLAGREDTDVKYELRLP